KSDPGQRQLVQEVRGIRGMGPRTPVAGVDEAGGRRIRQAHQRRREIANVAPDAPARDESREGVDRNPWVHAARLPADAGPRSTAASSRTSAGLSARVAM